LSAGHPSGSAGDECDWDDHDDDARGGPVQVVQLVADGLLKPWRAAQRLELTTRQVRQLVARLREGGPSGLVSGRCGKPGNNRLDAGTAARATAIIRERYADFGPTLARETLWECHGIGLAVETVRTLMRAAGLWIPRRERAPKVYQPRARRACLGELVQIDGSDHHWFEDRAPACTLLVYVDDATSRLMTLHFTATDLTARTTTPSANTKHSRRGRFAAHFRSRFTETKSSAYLSRFEGSIRVPYPELLSHH
jgi:hypothetical protein